jgi:hypothetical protein
MTTAERIACIVATLIWLFVIATNAHCGVVRHDEVSCHPGQHTCKTDAECEEEEAYFLDLDELHQSDAEILDLYNIQYNIERSKS